jgi:NADPH:quinone reductase-like Zn-dependent oxidoreductase
MPRDRGFVDQGSALLQTGAASAAGSLAAHVAALAEAIAVHTNANSTSAVRLRCGGSHDRLWSNALMFG